MPGEMSSWSSFGVSNVYGAVSPAGARDKMRETETYPGSFGTVQHLKKIEMPWPAGSSYARIPEPRHRLPEPLLDRVPGIIPERLPGPADVGERVPDVARARRLVDRARTACR
jgi:hypothetical protein